jgi:PilX N-terminal
MLLLVMTLLGVASLVAASLELRMAGNLQQQEHAFQAAEFAVEQALHSSPLRTAYTLSSPRTFPASADPAPMPGSGSDTYSYSLYFDSTAGGTPIPSGAEGGTVLVAYHFVIVGTGHSSRGAEATHRQGFYVLGPVGCDLIIAACSLDGAERTRTFWEQQGAE